MFLSVPGRRYGDAWSVYSCGWERDGEHSPLREARSVCFFNDHVQFEHVFHVRSADSVRIQAVLSERLRINVATRNRSSDSPSYSMGIVLRHRASPCRWGDREVMDGHSGAVVYDIAHGKVAVLVKPSGAEGTECGNKLTHAVGEWANCSGGRHPASAIVPS